MIAAIISAVVGAISLVWAWRNRDTLRWLGRIIAVIRDKGGNVTPGEKQTPIKDWWRKRRGQK